MDNNNQPNADLRHSVPVYVICRAEDVDWEAVERFNSESNEESASEKTYRWQRHFTLKRELDAIGEHELAGLSRRELSLAQAKSFGEALNRLADILEERLRDGTPEEQVHGAAWSFNLDSDEEQWVPDSRTSPEALVELLREGGRWYGEVEGEPMAMPMALPA
jgi:hypothetical protein